MDPSKLPKYSGEEDETVDSWIRRFEAAIRAQEGNVDDDAKKALATVLAPSVYETVCGMIDIESEHTTWAQIKEKMKSLWSTKAEDIFLIADMIPPQAPGQDVASLSRLFYKAKGAHPSIDLNMLVSVFVKRLRHEFSAAVFNKGLPATFDEVVKLAKKAEEDFIKINKQEVTPQVVAAPVGKECEVQSVEAAATLTNVCHICKKPGHYWRSCPVAVEHFEKGTWSKSHGHSRLTNVLKVDKEHGHRRRRQHRERRSEEAITNNTCSLHFPVLSVPTTKLLSISVMGTLNNNRVSVLPDTGAVVSLVKASVIRQLRLVMYHQGNINLVTADTRKLPVLGRVVASLSLGKATKQCKLLVVEDLPVDVILGIDILKDASAVVNLESGHLVFLGSRIPLTHTGRHNIAAVQQWNIGEDSTKHDIERLLTEFRDVFAWSEDQYGSANVEPMKLHLVSGASPVYRNARRVNPLDREKIAMIVNEWLRAGRVEVSESEWAAPVKLVPKSDGTDRLVTDFTGLNRLIAMDAYPHPLVANLFDQLSGCTIFSKLDFKSAYLQIPVAEESKALLSFVTPDGQYQYCYAPFGCKVSGAKLQRVLDKLFKGIPGVLGYSDDWLIASPTFDDHITILSQVFKRISESGFLLKPSKCIFAQKKVQFLGRLVSASGVEVLPESVKPILDMPSPKNKKTLSQFLGGIQWLRKFIPNCAAICQPLHAVAKPKATFHWGEEQQASFDKLKIALTTPPILAHPNFNKRFCVETDASGVGLGAVLLQDGRPIEYKSRALKPAERQLPITYLELLAVLYACEEWSTYLLGKQFDIVTDHQALTWLQKQKDAPGRLGQWATELSQFDYKISYRRGTHQGLSDPLSRMVGVVADTETSVFMQAQREDLICQHILEKQLKNYIINEKGILCKINEKWNLPFLVPVVPVKLINEVMRSLHDAQMHPGIAATQKLAKITFFWPAMDHDIAKYVKTCGTCITKKGVRTGIRKLIPMGDLSSTRFNEVVAVDVMSGLWPTKEGYDSVLMMIDHFSGYLRVAPLLNKTAASTAAAFEKYWLTAIGPPEKVHSDQGTEFTGMPWLKLRHEWKFKKSVTTPYHPQGDGIVERANRTLLNLLRVMTERNGDWNENLEMAVDLFNDRIRERHDASPNMVSFGKVPKIALSQQLGGGVQANEEELKKAKEEIAAAIKKQNLAKKAKCSAAIKKWNRRAKLKAGLIVYIRDRSIREKAASKMQTDWVGPYKIVSRPKDWHAWVQRLPNGNSVSVHVNDIIPAENIRFQDDKATSQVPAQEPQSSTAVPKIHRATPTSEEENGYYVEGNNTASNQQQYQQNQQQYQHQQQHNANEDAEQENVNGNPVNESGEQASETSAQQQQQQQSQQQQQQASQSGIIPISAYPGNAEVNSGGHASEAPKGMSKPQRQENSKKTEGTRHSTRKSTKPARYGEYEYD